MKNIKLIPEFILISSLYTGTVTLVSSLDYETAREYLLTIEARDHGEPPLTNSAILRVNVTDHNDNTPKFTQDEYRATVRENLQVGARIVTVGGVLGIREGGNGHFMKIGL